TIPAIKTGTHRGNPIAMSRKTVQQALTIVAAFLRRGHSSPNFIDARLAGNSLQDLESPSAISLFQVDLSEHIERQPFSGVRSANFLEVVHQSFPCHTAGTPATQP